MGQFFTAVAYDVETKTCFAIDADKFHANCYNYSGTVVGINYLLRQKPYRVMWGGGYVVIDDNLQRFSREEDLMGISTYEDLESFKLNNKDLHEKAYFDKVKRIDAYSKEWTWLDVYDEAHKHFRKIKSVKYSGQLVNHTKKLAIDLKSYWKKSVSYYGWREIACIDLVPALTETGGGLAMALLEGLTPETTELLAGTWCGDLLQIVKECPRGYDQINCCFANLVRRGSYLCDKYGTDEHNYLLKDKTKRFFGYEINIAGKRAGAVQLKVEEKEESGSWFKPIPISR